MDAPITSFERVQRFHARLFEIARVARGNGEVVLKRGGGNHSVKEWDCVSFPLQIHHQSGPSPTDRGVPRNAVNGLYNFFKPLLESFPLATAWNRENTDAQFAENERIHNEVSLIGSEPFDNLAIRRRPRRFAEYVRIYQVSHPSTGALMSSVVSVRSKGWYHPLTGQASSNFTSPWLRRRSLRFRRYSPRSMRSISNSCPASIASRCRISAGRMICPFVEIVVLILGKIMSYLPAVNLHCSQSNSIVSEARRRRWLRALILCNGRKHCCRAGKNSVAWRLLIEEGGKYGNKERIDSNQTEHRLHHG